MDVLHPLAAEMLVPAWAARVAAPAVDAMPSADLEALAARERWSFLHVSGTDSERVGHDAALAQASAHLRDLRAMGAYRRVESPGVALLRLTIGDRRHLGVVGDVAVEAVRAGRLRRHERTEPAKVASLAAHRARVGIDGSPVSLAGPWPSSLSATLTALAEAPPDVSVTTADAVRHELWSITDPGAVEEITAELSRVDALYVLDGHHRLAAAIRHAARTAGPPDDREAVPTDPGRVLSMVMAEDTVHLLDYRRVTPRPAGVSTTELLAAIRERFTVEPVADADAAVPRARGQIALWLDEAWYRLRADPAVVPARLPDRLDEVVVQRHLLAPVFGVADPATPGGLSYLAGTAPLSDAVRRLGSGVALVALHPLPMADLRAVADAGVTLPPKSTFLTPKPGAGLLLAPRRSPQ